MQRADASEFRFVLDAIRQEVATSNLLPREYSKYRPLLADGLTFFLERVPRQRLRRILEEQIGMNGSVSTAQRVVALLHHLPALHKLGQVLGRDRRLSPGFRRRLQDLESLPPRSSMRVLRQVLRDELGGWEKLGLRLSPEPLAEGSVAMVAGFWRGRQRNTKPQPELDGVFKVLKPRVSDWLDDDLEILGQLGDFLDEDTDRYHLPALDYRGTFDTIKELLVHEIRLAEEQQHLKEASRLYANVPGVRIPKLLPHCTDRLTAMTFMPGLKVTARAAEFPVSGQALARAAIRALICEPIFSRESDALFHADPHAGNLIATPTGDLAIIDWSLVGHLTKQERVELVQILLAAATSDISRARRAVQNLSRSPIQLTTVEQVLDINIRRFPPALNPGLEWFTKLLDELTLIAGVRFGPGLLLFRKVLLTLEGVLADVTGWSPASGAALIDRLLFSYFVHRWLQELPSRLVALPTNRAFSTHLSNVDAASWFLAAPVLARRAFGFGLW